MNEALSFKFNTLIAYVASEQIVVQLQILIWRTYVNPVIPERIAVYSLPFLQKRWKNITLKHGEGIGGDATQNIWFQDVNTSVNHIRSYNFATRLFYETFDPALAVGIHDTIHGRVFYRCHCQTGCSFVFAVQPHHPTQVNISEDIPIQDNERIVQESFSIFHCSGCSQGAVFYRGC